MYPASLELLTGLIGVGKPLAVTALYSAWVMNLSARFRFIT